MCDIKKVAFTSKVMKNSKLMDYMVSLHLIDFISWGVLDDGPLYCITLWNNPHRPFLFSQVTLDCCTS
jgi:hypothetical protein